MAKFGGAFLRLLQTILYAIEFCCAGIILGIYSYFLAVQADRHATIPTWQKAVEGLSGAAVLYLIFAVILTCFLGGVRVFAFTAIVLDVLFCGAMLAIAVMTRDGAHSCSGSVNTPLGPGNTNQGASGFGAGGWGFGGDDNATYAASPGLACRLNTSCFAVAIIAAFLFLVSAAVQLAIARNHQKEKRYGPSPKNNYTSGTGRRNIFTRKNKKNNKRVAHDTELGTAGGLAATEHGAYRPSHDTAYTGSTVAAPNTAAYDAHGKPLNGSHGYHGAPHGTAVNPYGYDNTHTVGTATNY